MKPLAQNTLIQNRYLIVQLIGKGGMGEVYLAVDQRLGSAVALKRTYFAGDEMLGNAFEREARTLARMRHPVLPKVSDHFGEGDEQYLVMEHISGDDLSKRLESAQKPFPISWVLFWADQLLDALAYLHSHEPPIIHRDIKPQNLKLTDENNIVLLDFGLSKTSTGQTNISQSGSTGSVVGYTPHYAPMEQIRGIGTSARSDLYSLSATLYQLLSGTVPPDALSRADAMLNGTPDPVKPLSDLNQEVSKAVSDVILKGMEVSQEKRFADAREMQKVLRRAFTQMQESMSAKTVAYAGSAETPVAVAGRADTRDAAASSGAAKSGGNQKPPKPADDSNDIDFDATIAIEPIVAFPRQSDVKTEVFLSGSDAFQIPVDERRDKSNDVFSGDSASVAEVPASFGYSQPPVEKDGNGFIADATMPIIAFENEDKSSVSSEPIEQNFKPQPAPAKKSSGKAAMIVGGLAALLVLTAIGAVGGWYLYSNYSAGAAAIVEPSPSPEPSIDIPPSPEPTLETVAETNTSIETNTSVEANSNVAFDSNTNIDTNMSVEPTPPPAAGRQPGEKSTRPQVPNQVRPPPVRPAFPPANRAAPKPKTPSDRTVILQ